MVTSRRDHHTAAGPDGPLWAPEGRAAGGDLAGEAAGLRIRLLGDFRVWVGGQAVGEAGWRLRKARSVVKLLALAPGQRLHREQLVEALWPDLDPEPALNNLKIALHVARYALEPPAGPHRGRAPPPRWLRLHGEVLSLAPADSVWVDVEAFEAAAAAARRAGHVAAYEAAAALYTGDLLPEDRYEDWASGRRDALRETYAALLLDLARLHEAAGEYDAAIETLRRVVVVDAACEAARCALMRLYARAGRRAEALRQYEHLRDVLRRELDAEPDPATQRLYREIWSGALAPTRPGLGPNGHGPPAAGPQSALEPLAARVRRTLPARPVPVPPARRSNLPVPLTSFVGRGQALADLVAYLAPPGGAGRLLTLVGAGGCGKTRLALKAAGRLVEAFPDGVWFVELAALADPDLVPQATCAALGLREVPPEAVVEALVAHLRPQRALLVLDNCEHVVGACAALGASLLQACPTIHILATSREPLRVPGEVSWRVPPLAVPPPGLPVPAPPGRLMEYEAVRLFVERAQAVQPGFALSEGNASAVAQVCSRLDGIPLAIELAAARVPALPVAQLAGRLDDCFRLLADGSRTAPARHQTLEAAINWSYDLLSAPERVLFDRLAVFAGGWTLEAAEEVGSMQKAVGSPAPARAGGADAGQLPPPPAGNPLDVAPGCELRTEDVLELLARLVDKSLVQMEEQPDGTARYRLLEPIRQYGHARLAAARAAAGSAEGEAIERRHAAYYLALAEQAEPKLTGPQQRVWLDRLAREHDNFRKALRWAIECGEADTGVRLGAALWRFWKVRGHVSECRLWIEYLLRGSVGTSAAVRAKALSGASQLARIDGDLGRAAALLEEGLALQRQLGDRRDIATALVELAVPAIDRGDWPRAAALLEESLALRRDVGDAWGIAASLHELGVVAREQGDLGRAAALLEEGLALQRQLKDDVQAAWSLYDLAILAADHQDDLPRAAVLYEESLSLWREAGYKQGLAQALGGLASLAYRQGDAAQAAARWRESLSLWRELGRKVMVTPCLEHLAGAAAAQGQAERAARLFGMAEAARETAGAPRRAAGGIRQYQQEVAEARAALGEAAFAAAWAAGRAVPLERAVAYALAEEEPAPPTGAPAQQPPGAGPRETLSGREREVAVLIARGLTNRQIAARLAIAEGTAANHVRHILDKLGFRSRTQIAGWAVARSLQMPAAE